MSTYAIAVVAYGGEDRGDVPPSWDGNLKDCPPFEKIEKISNQLSSFSQPIKDLNLK